MAIFNSLIRFKVAVAAGIVGVVAVVAPASATTIPAKFQSSWYQFVDDSSGISWADANSAASALTFMGASGHLATITSALENDFISSLLAAGTYTGFAGAWIGASVQGDADGTWEVGPEAGKKFSFYSYSNWGGVEPNDLNNNARVYMNIGDLFSGIEPGKWVDSAGGLARPSDPIKGYFVEYAVATTPVPAALPLFIFALGGLGLVGWRRRKAAA